MVQSIAAEKLTLYDLEQKFQLQRVFDQQFLAEWQNVVPALTNVEQERLERVQQHYRRLATRPLLDMVKMVVVSPLLDLAGFFDAPFYSTSEASMQLTAKDGKVTVRGKMDVLVLLEQVWVLVIESKRAEFSLKVGIPQVLAYMMAAPQGSQPVYGMVTNGSSFTFLKLRMASTPQSEPQSGPQSGPQYAQSDVFDIERGDDLARVLQILKQVGQTIRERG